MRIAAFLTGFLLLTGPALAQTAPATVPVFLALPGGDWRTKPMADAIRSALSRTPGFNLVASAVPGALVIVIPEGLNEMGHEDRAGYRFTVRFSRDGARIGESVQSCKASAVAECADQLAADAQSAAQLR